MNILRKKRKNNIKVRYRRYILLIFSLIMTTFAWITYYRILNAGVQFDIQSWDLSFYLDENQNDIAEDIEERENPMSIDLSDLYPGMEEKVVKFIIRNNGETPTDILYTSSELNILGNEYVIVDEVPEDTEYYILKHESVSNNGVTTVDFINEPERFPFKITIEHTQEILSGAEGYLTIRVTWPLYNEDDSDEEKNRKDELDTKWGYKVAKYLEDNIDNPDVTGAFHVKIRVNAIGKPREDYDESFTADIAPINYGEYVNYPIDLNSDGDTTNDWRIFYNNGNNVYLISADYVKNTLIPTEELGMTANGTYGVNGYNVNDSDLMIDTSVANKFFVSKAATFNASNQNYKATATLLDTEKWTSFVDSTYAESAIGSPTIEMWIRSWNSIYTTDKYSNHQLYCDNSNEYGYYIGTTSGSSVSSVDLSGKTGYQNTLYYPHKTIEDGCYGYWLASPSANDSDYVIDVYYDGYLRNSGYGNSEGLALRPVVCLNYNIKAEQDNNGIWNFSE